MRRALLAALLLVLSVTGLPLATGQAQAPQAAADSSAARPLFLRGA